MSTQKVSILGRRGQKNYSPTPPIKGVQKKYVDMPERIAITDKLNDSFLTFVENF
ncbi:MAG: hypothetical protein F6K08_18880 [Okeania sp. SIO1H6]|nr:hypothetical protein [Okeania sp. SIO1H6]